MSSPNFGLQGSKVAGSPLLADHWNDLVGVVDNQLGWLQDLLTADGVLEGWEIEAESDLKVSPGRGQVARAHCVTEVRMPIEGLTAGELNFIFAQRLPAQLSRPSPSFTRGDVRFIANVSGDPPPASLLIATGTVSQSGSHFVTVNNAPLGRRSLLSLEALCGLFAHDAFDSWVVCGLEVSGISGLAAELSPGIAWIAGRRLTFASPLPFSVPPSTDTYLDVSDAGLTLVSVPNGDPEPSLPSGRLRVAVVVSTSDAIAATSDWRRLSPRRFERLMMGSGMDGEVDFDGSSTVLGMAPANGVYTLARSIFPSNLLVRPGVTVIARSYEVIAAGTATILGTLHADGNAGSPGTSGGVQGAGGAMISGLDVGGAQGGATGGAGQTGNGSNAGMQTVHTSLCPPSSRASGGNGGAGASGSGGQGGTGVSVTYRPFGRYRGHILWGSTLCAGGGGGHGGGGGGGDGTNKGGGGGGGGSGGAVLHLCASTVRLGPAAVLRAAGGAGGAGGSAAVGNCGGGGGGGGGNGGAVILACDRLCAHPLAQVSVPGGTGGSGGNKSGTGSPGANGGNGLAGITNFIFSHGGWQIG